MMRNINDIDKLFEDSLSELEITPSPKVKSQIQKQMMLRNALKRYWKIMLIIILLLGVGVLWIGNNTMELSKQQSLLANKQSINSLTDDKPHHNTTGLDNKTVSSLTSQKEIASTEKQQKSDTKNNSRQLGISLRNKNADSQENNNDREDRLSKTIKHLSSSTPSSHLSNSSSKPEILSSSSSAEKVEKDETQSALTSSSSLAISVLQSKTTISKDNVISMPVIASLSCGLLETKPPQVLMVVPDDTVGIDINKQPIVLPSHRWSLLLYVAPNYSFSNYVASAKEYQSLTKVNQLATTSLPGYQGGLGISYQLSQLFIESAISYVQYRQCFTTTEKTLSVVNTPYWEYHESEQWQVDTTMYINIDSLLGGDTVITYREDSTRYIIVDSTKLTRNDSSWTTNDIRLQNVYQYVELPLSVYYTFNRNKHWQPFAGVGVVSGMFWKSKSYYMADNEVVSTESLPFAKFVFWANVMGGVRYQYTKRISFSVSGQYRYLLNHLFVQPTYFNQKINAVNLNLGVYYRF